MVAAASVLNVEALAARFQHDGYVVAPLYTVAEMAIIHDFAVDWIRGLMNQTNGGQPLPGPIESYHLWHADSAIDHGSMLRAHKRHRAPDGAVAEALQSPRLWALLAALAPGKALSLWDEGLGWLGFRLIRPGLGDGYPWSCKAWGPAKSVLSLWIPVIGRTSQETIALWPGSHRMDLESVLPENTKFTKDERRLVGEPPAAEVVRPELDVGEAIVFGPRTIHSEDVTTSSVTRLNLEMRIAVAPEGRPC